MSTATIDRGGARPVRDPRSAGLPGLPGRLSLAAAAQ
jgi:hypothetical protein